jgi:DNA-binding NtrC family response regulator
LGETVRRILFVDDDRSILDVLRVLLARDAFDVHTAVGADEARRMLSEGPYDVVVVDAHMPGTNGVALLSEIRERYPQMVRMMLTGSGDVSVAMQAVNEGSVFRFLVKPPDPVVLRRAVADALEVAEKTRKEAQLLRLTLEQQSLMRELYAGGSADPRDAKSAAREQALTEVLSPRELEVAQALVRVGDADTVARTLGVSPHTVRTHLKSMFRKLDVHSQSALLSRLYGLGVRPE